MSINVSTVAASLGRRFASVRKLVQQPEPLAWQLCQSVAVGLSEQHSWSAPMIADLLGCSPAQAARFVREGATRQRENSR